MRDACWVTLGRLRARWRWSARGGRGSVKRQESENVENGPSTGSGVRPGEGMVEVERLPAGVGPRTAGATLGEGKWGVACVEGYLVALARHLEFPAENERP